ncbi:MAG TPA: RsmE family RNA methyltransferase [Opitutaceae bacterium]|nr:RsmE family RNA methyltransferase [Opitutaceae bacterium]
MNLILFAPEELARPLAPGDPRAEHLRTTLRRQAGDSFDAGLVNGPRGRARIDAIDAAGLHLSFAWGPIPPPLPPLALVAGLPRPQTARDILRDATTLGATALHFVQTEKSERSYASSALWRDEWRRHVIAGAQQAFDTRIPEVTHGRPLRAALEALPAGGARLALDPYEATAALAAALPALVAPCALAIGPERGWTAADRAELRAAGFSLVHLGARVLRTETAVVAALTLARSRLDPA